MRSRVREEYIQGDAGSTRDDSGANGQVRELKYTSAFMLIWFTYKIFFFLQSGTSTHGAGEKLEASSKSTSSDCKLLNLPLI